jgi:hypothetical protein
VPETAGFKSLRFHSGPNADWAVRRSLGRLRPGLAAGCIIRVEGTDAYVKDGHEPEEGEGGKHLLDLEGASLARSRELTSIAGEGEVRGVDHMTVISRA